MMTCPVPDEAIVKLVVPWQLVIDVTFNGGWSEINPETGKREFSATGGYRYTHTEQVGPCQMSY